MKNLKPWVKGILFKPLISAKLLLVPFTQKRRERERTLQETRSWWSVSRAFVADCLVGTSGPSPDFWVTLGRLKDPCKPPLRVCERGNASPTS